MSNDMSLAIFDAMSADQIDALAPQDMLAIAELIDAAEARLKRISARWADAMARRYKARAHQQRSGDTGTARLMDGDYEIVSTIPKKVEWDQARLQTILAGMPEAQARHYAKVTFAVDERIFKAAPPDIQAALAPARTVKPGKEKFEVMPAKKDAA